THLLGDPLPARADPRARGAELAIEASGPVDRAEETGERDDAPAEVDLARAPERGDNLVKRQDRVDVSGRPRHARPQPGQRLTAAGTQGVVGRVGRRPACGERGNYVEFSPPRPRLSTPGVNGSSGS